MTVPALRDWTLGARIAGLSLVVALALDVVALARHRTMRDTGAVTPLVIRPVPRIVIHLPGDAGLIHAAANRAPFALAPPAGAPVTAVAMGPPIVVAPVPRHPKLVGTVVEGNGGGFVIVELPDARMQVVRIGERAGELRLRSISAGEAVFDDPTGRRVSLRTPLPGSESRP